jgi:F420-non-reducing hydrogenase small subunit
MSGIATTPVKPRLAVYWASACGGCDIAILNLHERILDVAGAFEIVFWPAVMDAKVADVQAMPDRFIDLCLVSGGMRTTENEAMARLLRRTSRVLVAFGSCANEGCIPGLANLSTVASLLDAAFEGPSTDNPEHLRPVTTWSFPEGEVHIPELLPRVRTLDQVVPVDWSVPGCPPESARIAEVMALAAAAFRGDAEAPPRGSVLGAAVGTVCEECARARNVKRVSAFRRIQDVPSIDPLLCLLEQGIPCNGPATRAGCGALCPAAGAQCIGCYGPPDGVIDQGARLLSALASALEGDRDPAIERALDGLVDPVGQAYRFGLARSILGGARVARPARAPGPRTEPAAAHADRPQPDQPPAASTSTAADRELVTGRSSS